MDRRRTFGEFFRYLFAGGFAFVVDFVTLIACRELLFRNVGWGVYVSVFLAFAAGHVANYLLSMRFVFRDPEENRRGKTWRAFWLFALVAAFGMGVTELGMWVGYGLLGANYVGVKVVMATVVFVLNFIGRKVIVMRGGLMA